MSSEVPAGEFWYAMTDDGSRPFGYARMAIGRAPAGTLSVEWELRLAHEDGEYEENRTMEVDAGGDLLFAEYRVFGNLVCAGRRSEDGWAVTTIEEGKPVTRPGELPPNSMAGLGFVFAAAVPREPGGRFERTELDDADGLKPIGTTVLTWEGKGEREWEGERLPVNRILLEKADGRKMPIEVAEDGRIVSSDWGGGNRMLLSRTSTKDLYRPKAPVLTTVPGPEDTLVMEGSLARFTPEEVFDHFTKQELLARFWAPKAEVGEGAGGRYELEWPGHGSHLLGKIREWEPGRRLSFTWNWAHTPDAPELVVTMEYAPREGGGTSIRLTQGPYRLTEADRKEREGHEEGWRFFFARLRSLGG